MSVPLFDGVEPIVDALVARFNAEIEGAVDAINAQDEKNIQLEPVTAILDYIPTPSELNIFPTVAIGSGADHLADDIGHGATGTFEIVVVVFVQDVDQRQLSIKLRRYLRAVRSVALYGRQFGPAWGVVDKGSRPGPTLGRDEGPREWMSYVSTVIECRSEEDTP